MTDSGLSDEGSDITLRQLTMAGFINNQSFQAGGRHVTHVSLSMKHSNLTIWNLGNAIRDASFEDVLNDAVIRDNQARREMIPRRRSHSPVKDTRGGVYLSVTVSGPTAGDLEVLYVNYFPVPGYEIRRRL